MKKTSGQRRFIPLLRAAGACALAAMLSAGLGACTTTGHHFNPCAVARLTPGVSTYPEAVAKLGSVPVATYIQDDGSFIAHWYLRDSVVTDALYHHQGVMLLFGADAYLLRPVNGRKAALCGLTEPAAT